MNIIYDYTLIAVFIIIYCLLMLVFTLKLLVYHILLIKSNQTTKEEISNSNKVFLENPYEMQSNMQNLKEALWPKQRNESFLIITDMRISDTLFYVNLSFKKEQKQYFREN